ncbi:UNKNOWN [Stylonychia lemnae]|uniref:Uncharacterized protein n=1 Tax=Stylonychia lemnae TaxID=5949 RepID=A0A078AMW5_STYLE|nr:UNKNOWN [Stylonychia lemnae]|eukprot:CDW83266.1 UNKNOWN [Stylonychia lemnae]
MTLLINLRFSIKSIITLQMIVPSVEFKTSIVYSFLQKTVQTTKGQGLHHKEPQEVQKIDSRALKAGNHHKSLNFHKPLLVCHLSGSQYQQILYRRFPRLVHRKSQKSMFTDQDQINQLELKSIDYQRCNKLN